MNKICKIICSWVRDEIISKWIRSLLTFILLAFGAFVISRCRNWLTTNHLLELPGWLWVAIVCIIALTPLFVVFVIYLIHIRIRSQTFTYDSDEIFGVWWKWSCYQTKTGEDFPYTLFSYCPCCAGGLSYDTRNYRLYCRDCGFEQVCHFDLGEDFVEVRREVERRLRTGGYKQAKKRLKKLLKGVMK